jgi:hypothetical protein
MPGNLQFVVFEGQFNIVFDNAGDYDVGDTVTAQWAVVNAGDEASGDDESCAVDVTDPTGAGVSANPSAVGIPALPPGQQSDLLTTQFEVTMPTSPVALYTVVVTLPNGQSTQNTCTVAEP